MSQEAFDAACAAAKSFKVRPADEDLLVLYGLFKQATAGDNTTTAPWSLQFEAKAKWDAWTAKKGLSAEDAKKQYIEKVESLKAAHA